MLRQIYSPRAVLSYRPTKNDGILRLLLMEYHRELYLQES